MSQKITFPEWVASAEQTGRDKAMISDELGITITSLYRYLSRDRVPNRAVMDRIITASGGSIDVSWFFAPSTMEEAQ